MTNETINTSDEFNYDYVASVARVATYDDLKSAPRITLIEPAPTNQFIMNMATKTYEQAKLMGGSIPFTIIKEVSENFIHAKFSEITISILDEGNTIRFADQGPGISNKEKAQLPGFTSAVEPMKQYIRGVGSGLPIVKDYFDEKNGSVTIDDNILSGAVVTISLKDVEIENEGITQQIPSQMSRYDNTITDNQTYINYQQPVMMGNNNRVPVYMPSTAVLSQRGENCLKIIHSEGPIGVTEIATLAGLPASSAFGELKKLEEAGLISKGPGKKRSITQLGITVINML